MKDSTGISDAEARRIIMTTTKLRMTSTYQAAERMRRALGADRSIVMRYGDSGDAGERDKRRVVGYVSAALVRAEE